MNLFQSIFSQAKEENRPLTFRINSTSGPKLYFGYLLDYNPETVSVKSVTSQGLPNGILFIKTEDLYGLDYDDMFLRKLEIKEMSLRALYADTSIPALFHIGNCSFDEILLQAKKEEQLVYVNMYQDLGLYGYIRDLNESEFLIEVYNTFGEYDGTSVQLIENIKHINWDDEDTRIVKMLVDKRKSGY